MARNVATLLNSVTTYSDRAKDSRLVNSWSEETAAQLQAITAKVLEQVTALAAREKTILSNPKLSTNGKFDATKSEVKNFVDGLKWMRLEKALSKPELETCLETS